MCLLVIYNEIRLRTKFITLLSLYLVLEFAGFVNLSIVSSIWKDQKDFRREILGPSPVADFAIGGK